MAVLVGADVGGTFTDFAIYDAAGGLLTQFKVPSSRLEPEQAVVAGFRQLLEEGFRPDGVTLFVHGTTIALNTLLQRSGVRVGLITTRGFRDVLRLRRLRLAGAPGFSVAQPPPLVRRHDVRELGARMLADGTEIRPLVRAEVTAAADELLEAGCQALAVCLLHSYRNPAHERAAEAHIRERHPDVDLSLSHQIWPQQREYERTEVTVINAHVAPPMRRYFERLADGLQELGITAPIFSTKSSGGITRSELAAARPVETLVSGPASGVVAGAALSRATGVESLVALDMGGTSADVGIIEGGRLRTSTEVMVGDFPVIMPAVDVSSIGAGGGSIAWLDSSGVLKVGPQSSGAEPGPACYGRGGTEATVTDAYVTLGLIGQAGLLGGQISLDRGAAIRACAEIGARLQLTPEAASEAILEVVTSNMYSRLLPLMAQRGANPREYALLAYGGAGPTHAFLLAREAGFQQVLVPPNPGTFCALGCVLADIRADFVHTAYSPLSALGEEGLTRIFLSLEAEAAAWLDQEGLEIGAPVVEFAADMRYRGQSYELAVNLPEPRSTEPLMGRLRQAFEQTYSRHYGEAAAELEVELINARAHVLGPIARPDFLQHEGGGGDGRVGRGRVYCEGSWSDAAVVGRDQLRRGQRLAGPAVITQYDTTVFVPPDFAVEVGPMGVLLGGPG